MADRRQATAARLHGWSLVPRSRNYQLGRQTFPRSYCVPSVPAGCVNGLRHSAALSEEALEQQGNLEMDAEVTALESGLPGHFISSLHSHVTLGPPDRGTPRSPPKGLCMTSCPSPPPSCPSSLVFSWTWSLCRCRENHKGHPRPFLIFFP